MEKMTTARSKNGLRLSGPGFSRFSFCRCVDLDVFFCISINPILSDSLFVLATRCHMPPNPLCNLSLPGLYRGIGVSLCITTPSIAGMTWMTHLAFWFRTLRRWQMAWSSPWNPNLISIFYVGLSRGWKPVNLVMVFTETIFWEWCDSAAVPSVKFGVCVNWIQKAQEMSRCYNSSTYWQFLKIPMFMDYTIIPWNIMIEFWISIANSSTELA